MPLYGSSHLLRKTCRNPHHLSSVLAACVGRVRSPTEARHVTEVSDIAAPLHQVHQTGFAQRGRRSLYSGRMGSGAGRRSDDIPMQFHTRSIKLAIQDPGCKIDNSLQGAGFLKQMSGSRD
jgi:hypothetical protein